MDVTSPFPHKHLTWSWVRHSARLWGMSGKHGTYGLYLGNSLWEAVKLTEIIIMLLCCYDRKYGMHVSTKEELNSVWLEQRSPETG